MTKINPLLARISTRTPHAGSDAPVLHGVLLGIVISTRTPHAGSDLRQIGVIVRIAISTRTPHAGSDCNIMCKFTASINI